MAQYVYAGGSVGGQNVNACADCGALVQEGSTQVHDAFHRALPPADSGLDGAKLADNSQREAQTGAGDHPDRSELADDSTPTQAE